MDILGGRNEGMCFFFLDLPLKEFGSIVCLRIIKNQFCFQVFEELLLDADWSVNAGMWMWLSCSSFFQQFFHCYCPVKFGRKADPNGDYIRYEMS